MMVSGKGQTLHFVIRLRWSYGGAGFVRQTLASRLRRDGPPGQALLDALSETRRGKENPLDDCAISARRIRKQTAPASSWPRVRGVCPARPPVRAVQVA
jgi:hypothetical protein